MDMRYVLDQLEVIKAGSNPDYEQRELPPGLAETLNLAKVGIFGHSAGGATSSQVMYDDDRVDAGIDMDGIMGYMPDHPLPVAQYGLNRPFLLMNAGYFIRTAMSRTLILALRIANPSGKIPAVGNWI